VQTAGRKAVVGSLDLEKLATSQIERRSLDTLLERQMHKRAIALKIGGCNFVRVQETHGGTPALLRLESRKVVELATSRRSGSRKMPNLKKLWP
jgi:hypothetical protein